MTISQYYYILYVWKNLIKYRTCVANINYHLVFVVKYRREILDDITGTRLKELMIDISNDKGFTIQAMEIGDKNHIHLFVTAKPIVSISQIVKCLKGISARKLLIEYPNLRKNIV